MSNIISQCLNPNCQQRNLSGTRVCIRCGTNLVLDNRYRLEKFIGKGGFGRTFKAIDEKKLNKPCVVKQFFPQQIGSAALAKATELFHQEAVRLDQLGSHPQIPDLLAFFQQEGRFYLIQQFIDGQDLLKELNQNGKFSESQIYHLLRELLPVLEFIHSHGIIHRDIKPDNIIRNSQGNLVLIDFGVSKLLGGSILTSMGTITGTPSYAPPEQMRGIVYPASDLYSLGVTCIRLLTGCLPKQDGSDELFDPINLQWKWRTKVNVSSDLADLIDQMVERLPRQRPTNASEVLQALTDQQSPRYKSLPTLRLIPQLITQPNRSLNPAVSFPVIKIFGIGVMAIALLNSSSHKTISTAEYMSSSNIETSESTNPIIKCSTPYYFITVTKNKDQGYIYTAYEITVSNSTPSLVLSGQKEDDTKMKKYIFKNGLYSYVIYQKFEGPDSQIYLQINQPGKRPIQSICQRVV